jgi:hypothetical protein
LFLNIKRPKVFNHLQKCNFHHSLHHESDVYD